MTSNGYDELAEEFVVRRSPTIGVETVREWAQTLRPGASILELGCGDGVPISRALIADGFTVFGVDASATLIARFRDRFPDAETDCSPVEASDLFGRTFDAALAWGLMFLLRPQTQQLVIRKVAARLNPGGKFVFTAPAQCCTWRDALTGRESISLGLEAYTKILSDAGLTLYGQAIDEGDNHYYLAAKLV